VFSVTKRIANVQQPKLGYIPPEKLKVEKYLDSGKINEIDSAYKSIQGMVVDYLTRYMNGAQKHIAFQISLRGAEKVNELDKAQDLLSKINDLDADSICAACQLVAYDVAYRRGPSFFVPVEKVKPSRKMIQNIIISAAGPEHPEPISRSVMR
jgi:hypothetical protein